MNEREKRGNNQSPTEVIEFFSASQTCPLHRPKNEIESFINQWLCKPTRSKTLLQPMIYGKRISSNPFHMMKSSLIKNKIKWGSLFSFSMCLKSRKLQSEHLNEEKGKTHTNAYTVIPPT